MRKLISATLLGVLLGVSSAMAETITLTGDPLLIHGQVVVDPIDDARLIIVDDGGLRYRVSGLDNIDRLRGFVGRRVTIRSSGGLVPFVPVRQDFRYLVSPSSPVLTADEILETGMNAEKFFEAEFRKRLELHGFGDARVDVDL